MHLLFSRNFGFEGGGGRNSHHKSYNLKKCIYLRNGSLNIKLICFDVKRMYKFVSFLLYALSLIIRLPALRNTHVILINQSGCLFGILESTVYSCWKGI